MMLNKAGPIRSAVQVCVVIAFLCGSSVSSKGGEDKAIKKKRDVSDSAWSYLDLWDHTTLYSSSKKKNPYVQTVKIIGRYNGQYHYIDSNRGNDDGWENRRIRLGAQIDFLSSFKFKAMWNVQDPQNFEGPFLNDLDVFYIDWKVSKALSFRIGRQKSKVSQERATTSRAILTFNRSLLVNQTTLNKTLGLTGTYKFNGKLWAQAGVFSDLLDDKFHSFEESGSVGALIRLGYDLNKKTKMGLDYGYSNRKKGSREFKRYRHVISWNSTSKWDGYGLNTDVMFARGSGARNGDNMYGLMLMPWYDISKKLQGVFRYQLVTSDSESGIFLQKRYEAFAVNDGGGRRGDLYNSFYAGLNYRLNKDKLKLMLGSEYSNMSGRDYYSGWTYWSGVRIYW
ncbi:MAG: porin [Verrucomicrobiota bacterium]